MDKRVIVLGAGTGASNNLIRSLRAGDPSLFIVGAQVDRFVLKKSSADRNCLLPASNGPALVRALRGLVDPERTVLIPNSDADVKAVSDVRAEVPCRTFLPTADAIDLCQDKFLLTQHLRARRIPAPVTVAIDDLDNIERLFTSIASHTPIWCRIRAGGGSMGAAPMRTPDHVRGWITYWRDMRGVPVTSFTLSEYLPGRDYACQGLWKDGTLVLLKMCERLSYFGGRNQPSGTSSTPALGKLVFEPRVAEVCVDAVSAVDPRASGVFSIDLKEDTDGVPCVTEINAGRFCMITNVFDLTGQHNMAALYLRLAFDEPVEVSTAYDTTDDVYLVRDLDTVPGIFHADDFFTEIDEAEVDS
jgi:biotin carboxylase